MKTPSRKSTAEEIRNLDRKSNWLHATLKMSGRDRLGTLCPSSHLPLIFSEVFFFKAPSLIPILADVTTSDFHNQTVTREIQTVVMRRPRPYVAPH